MARYGKILLLFSCLLLAGVCVLHAQTAPKWILVNATTAKLPAKNGNQKLPLKYTVYKTDNTKLKQYLTDIKKGKQQTYEMLFPVSKEAGLQNFVLSNAEVMSPALAAKYSQLISLKGFAKGNQGNTTRVNYDGVQLRVDTNWNGKEYFIMPWKKGKSIYYVVYCIDDSGQEKRPFEAR